MQEMFESMQRAWGIAPVPQLTPTLDPDEIDRRIADLNTVAQWLSLNQNMVQSTIQTLQMQRATITALQSFGEAGRSMTQAAAAAASAHSPAAPPAASRDEAADPPPAHADPAPSAANTAEQWWAILQQQFEQIAGTALASMTPPSPGATGGSTTGKSAGGRRGGAGSSPASGPTKTATPSRARKRPAAKG